MGEHKEERASHQGEGVGRSLFGSISNSVLSNTCQSKPAHQAKSYEQVFIGHAKSWVSAEKYAIAALQGRASADLVRELAHWTISPPAFLTDFYVYSDRTARGCRLHVSSLNGWMVLGNETSDFGVNLVD